MGEYLCSVGVYTILESTGWWASIPAFATLRTWDPKVGISVVITQRSVSLKGKAQKGSQPKVTQRVDVRVGPEPRSFRVPQEHPKP